MVQAPYLILVFVHSIYPAFASKSLFASSLINTGRIQYSGAVGISHVKTVIFCAETCKHNIKCMTFFYNTLSTECVLHSKTFRYQDPDQAENGWKMHLLTEKDSRCKSDISGFLHYRALDLCYNFNPQHNIDYDGNIVTTCSSYGGELLRIDSQERQTYMEHILVGRPTDRVAIEGHSYNPGYSWTLADGTPLPYTNWRPQDLGMGHINYNCSGEINGPNKIPILPQDTICFFVSGVEYHAGKIENIKI